MTELILPGHPDYAPTLAHAPFWWRTIASTKAEPGFCVQRENGLFEPMSRKEFLDWAYGGEYREEFGITEKDYELDFVGEPDSDSSCEPRVGEISY